MQCNEKFLRALEEVYDEQFDEYMSSIENRQPHEFSAQHEKEMEKLIKLREKPYYRFVCTAGRRAACIIIAVIIFAAAAMSVKAVRKAVFRFFTSIFSNHIVVSACCDPDAETPGKVLEEYCITDLPEGFELTQSGRTDDSVTIVYNRSDKYVMFEQCTKQAFRMYIDNEYTKSEECCAANGTKYSVYSKDASSTIIWDNGTYIFGVTSNLDKNDALELCKSTKIKK